MAGHGPHPSWRSRVISHITTTVSSPKALAKDHSNSVGTCTASVLRGSYHLYQGASAGFGNIVMGVVFGYFYHRTSKVWPLILAHFLIDAVAFVGYQLVPGSLLSSLGIAAG